MTTTCSNTLLIIIVSTYIRVDCERNRETTTTKLIIVAITILIIIVVAAAAAATTITKHIIVAIAILIIAAAATTNKKRTLKMIICITLCFPAYLKYVFYTATKVKSEYMYIRQKKCENSERVSH